MKFGLKEKVVVDSTGQLGTVTGRAEYSNAESTYYVKHVDGNGNLKYSWFDESDLVKSE